MKNKTLLHIAVEQGKLEEVKQLLYQGADVNARDICKNTPLHLTIIGGLHDKNLNHEIIKILLEHKADISAKNIMNATPAHIAAYSSLELIDKFAVLKLFIDYGADIDIPDGDEITIRQYINEVLKQELLTNYFKDNYSQIYELLSDVSQSINQNNQKFNNSSNTGHKRKYNDEAQNNEDQNTDNYEQVVKKAKSEDIQESNNTLSENCLMQESLKQTDTNLTNNNFMEIDEQEVSVLGQFNNNDNSYTDLNSLD